MTFHRAMDLTLKMTPQLWLCALTHQSSPLAPWCHSVLAVGMCCQPWLADSDTLAVEGDWVSIKKQG